MAATHERKASLSEQFHLVKNEHRFRVFSDIEQDNWARSPA
jgi:hypothetical protein